VKSGVIAAVVALLAVGAAVPAMAQEANLPPLIVNSPDDVSVTQSGSTYQHVVSTNDFLVIDDGDADPTIYCTIGSIANSTKAIHNQYNHEASAYGTVWSIPDGTHTVLCTVTDDSGKTATDTHTVAVDVQGALFPNDAAKQRIKRIAHIFGNGVINVDTYHLIIKYYHRAGFIDFDIVRDGSGGFTSSHDSSRSCDPNIYNFAYSYSGVVSYWRNENSGHDDVFYKQCLERIAETGHFDRINLGF